MDVKHTSMLAGRRCIGALLRATLFAATVAGGEERGGLKVYLATARSCVWPCLVDPLSYSSNQ